MQSEFAKNALRSVDPQTVWNAETDPLHSRTPLSERDAGLGYAPNNRHDRRKAKKLLRKAHKYA
jgi:hypothetical protein